MCPDTKHMRMTSVLEGTLPARSSPTLAKLAHLALSVGGAYVKRCKGPPGRRQSSPENPTKTNVMIHGNGEE